MLDMIVSCLLCAELEVLGTFLAEQRNDLRKTSILLLQLGDNRLHSSRRGNLGSVLLQRWCLLQKLYEGFFGSVLGPFSFSLVAKVDPVGITVGVQRDGRFEQVVDRVLGPPVRIIAFVEGPSLLEVSGGSFHMDLGLFQFTGASTLRQQSSVVDDSSLVLFLLCLDLVHDLRVSFEEARVFRGGRCFEQFADGSLATLDGSQLLSSNGEFLESGRFGALGPFKKGDRLADLFDGVFSKVRSLS